jgi:hypothetical protein
VYKSSRVAILIRSKWVLIFLFHVCDRPYRVITVDKRSSVAKNAGRLSTNALTWLLPCLRFFPESGRDAKAAFVETRSTRIAGLRILRGFQSRQRATSASTRGGVGRRGGPAAALRRGTARHTVAAERRGGRVGPPEAGRGSDAIRTHCRVIADHGRCR